MSALLVSRQAQMLDDILAGAPVVIFQCPACGKTVEETQGNECEIKSIRCSLNEPILTDERARS
jgi:hypothetical protein